MHAVTDHHLTVLYHGCCRNVLVSDGGHACVKLSDLGLSRTLSTSAYYRKTSNDKVRHGVRDMGVWAVVWVAGWVQ